ncbi:hypothetical protein GF376_04155 [Candidatus Peregrinibacteria bacterium]|nr:hypothetical protein [Candidatus Peregrinibacteria bacterium]
MDNLRHILKELGLNEKEISIYIYLLTTACSPAGSLSRNLMIKRPTCYALVNSLISKGLIGQMTRNNMQYFFAVDPLVWMENYGFKQNLLLKKIEKVKNEISQVDLRRPVNEKPAKAVYFSGNEGITQILMDVLASDNQELRAFVSSNLNSFVDSFIPGYEDLRSGKGVFAKAIHTFEDNFDQFGRRDAVVSRETRRVAKNFDLGVDLLGYGNKNAIISIPEKFGLIVESEMIASAFRKGFDFLWRFAKS